MNEAQQQQAHPAAVAQEFMKRADMKGGEVEAYAQTFNWLGQILSGEVIVTPKEGHQSTVDELVALREEVRQYLELHGPLPEEEEEVETVDVTTLGGEPEEIPVLEPEAEAGEPELEAVES